MRCIIVSGLSGSGKSSVMKILEDDGFYCVDNIPAPLISTFLQLANDANEPLERIAIGLDIRGLEFAGPEKAAPTLEKTLAAIRSFREQGFAIDVIFLEASSEVLIKRYKETRRIHPLFALSPDAWRAGDPIADAI